jgi:hypothetical protein
MLSTPAFCHTIINGSGYGKVTFSITKKEMKKNASFAHFTVASEQDIMMSTACGCGGMADTLS